MLQAIRTRAGGIIVKVLFGLLIISFGFWGIYTRSDYFQGHSPDTVIATVGSRDIRAEELQQALRPALERLRAQLGTAIDPQQVRQLGILDTLLDQLINRALLDQETARLGIEVSDEVVRSAIYDNPAFKGPDGRFDRAMFQQVLMMNQLSEEQLVERLRHEIPRSDLLQALTVGIAVPRPVIETVYRYRAEKRLADIVAFPATAAPDPGQPGEADLTKFYEAHPDLFRAPEYRGFTVIGLAPSDVQKPGDIPEEKVKQEYQQRKDEFELPERREVQQILAPSEEKATEAQAALAAGKDWKEVATTIAGQDPETIDLGLLKKEELPDLLGSVAFELPVDKPSEPIKSPLGWHILRVVKIEAPTTQSYEQAKPQIEDELARQEAADRLDKIANQADDALAGGAALADVAAKFGLKTATIAAADNNGRDPEGKPVQIPVAPNDALKTAFDTDQNETSRVVDTQDGSIFAVHIDKVTPPQVRPLAEVKDKAVAAWQAEQKRAAVVKEAEALAATVKPDQPLAKVAADKKLTVTPSPPLARSAEAGNPVPPALVSKLFAAKQGDVVTATDATGAYAAQLKEIQVPETVPDDLAKALSDQLRGEARVDVAGEFTEALRKRYPIEIKRDALDHMF
jgi:peptidyl-prolyl cis-trans isomerase D